MSYPTVAVASVMLIAGTLSPQGGKQPQLLRGIAFRGQISYGLYVFHLAILHLIQTYGLHPLLTAPVALVCTVVVAVLSYYFLESPLLRLKERFARVRSRPVDPVFESPVDLVNAAAG